MFVYYDRGSGNLIGENQACLWDREGFVSCFSHVSDCVWMIPGTFDVNED